MPTSVPETKRSVVLTAMALKALHDHPLTNMEGVLLWRLAKSLPVAGAVISQSELGEATGATPARISQAMKRLCEIGFLTRGVKVGRSHHYKLNPAFIKVLS